MAARNTTQGPLTFSDLLPITQTSSHTYTTNLQDAFCIGTVPNGGYVTTAFLVAARTHMATTHPRRRCPDPINLHLQFLRRTATGPATFAVRDLKLGARVSNLHITLRQHRDPADASTPLQDEVEGYVVMSDMAREDGLSRDTQYTLSPPALPVSLTDLARNADGTYILRRRDPYGSFRRATLNIEMYLVRPEKRPEGSSLAVADQWVRFCPLDPEITSSSVADSSSSNNIPLTEALKHNTPLPQKQGAWTNDALGFLVDVFPQLNERFLNQAVEDAVLTDPAVVSDAQIMQLVRDQRSSNRDNNDDESSTSTSTSTSPVRTFWYPTLLLNLDVKKKLPDAGVEWLFVRVQAKKIERGRFDLCVEVRDAGGDVVALSTHASLIVDASRNMKRDGKPKPKPKPEPKQKKENKL